MGNVFMKKCNDVFEISKKIFGWKQLKEDYDFLIIDFHGEIASEKNAIGHFLMERQLYCGNTHTFTNKRCKDSK